jgi:lysophospholipase L1-like esterase
MLSSMKSRSILPLLLWAVLATAISSHAASRFYLNDGDRVVFYGDSITDQRLYTTFAETYVVTRFPHLEVSFVHSGWGGDRVTGGGGGPIDRRLPRDVYAYHPTVMTIMLGMNDASYRAYDQRIFETFSNGYEHIIDSVKKSAPGIRITVIQPSPFDDVTHPPRFEGGYNAVLLRYAQFVKELAEREHLDLADLNTPVVATLEKAKAANADLAVKLIPDRVHPGPAGHMIMAEALLKSWQAPALVTRVEIDAANKRVTEAVSTQVSNLKVESGLSWKQEDEALPMPVDLRDPVVALAMTSSDFIEALDQQPLQVTGLNAARYVLKIDGQKVGSYTKDQLAQGVNLATEPTPMAEQARKVHELTLQHNNIHFTRWRQVQVPLENKTSSKVHEAVENLMAAFDEEEAEVVKQQRAAAGPVARAYELVPE